MKRAKKWEILFKKANFDAIMDAIYPVYNPGAFDKACENIMTVEEREWLRNYLKNCGTSWAPTGVLEAAAGTGW